jgi:trans-aconitate methyltransferase
MTTPDSDPSSENSRVEAASFRRTWDAELYDGRHAFVWKSGAGLLEWLAPQPHETVLDLGCGTGHLSAQIATRAARVVGFDSSSAMVEAARRAYPASTQPNLSFAEADATSFSLSSLGLSEPVDAVFSNATLHWVRPPQSALECISQSLRRGGRLVAEFGGHGNVEQVLSALEAGLRSMGVSEESSRPRVRANYFPRLGEYASLCEERGLQVLRAELFDRPTPLEGPYGLREWVRMFRSEALLLVPQDRLEDFWSGVEERARPNLHGPNGWHADYRRLRLFVVKA